jgi:hypothetical protein
MSGPCRSSVGMAAIGMPTLFGRVVERTAVEQTTRDAMFRLLAAHFVGVNRDTFERDLASKTAVILLEDPDGSLRGFSTLLVYSTTVEERTLSIVYSGDTIVERGWWGNPALPRTWLRAVRQLAPYADADVYWLLLTSGFRTYRFLPVFYRSFYPRFDDPTPTTTRLLVDAIARAQFGACYDETAGVVRFPRPQVLSSDLLDVSDGRVLDPHVRFFLECNPGYVAGDELVCFARVHDENLTPAARRIARSIEANPCR